MKTPSPSINMLPLQGFIAELSKLQNHRELRQIQNLFPFVNTAYGSLLKLRECADQLPDLSGTRWFLHPHYASACERTFAQLELSKRDLIILGVKAHEAGDCFDILSLTAGFMKFAERAAKSPEVFQQAVALEFPLCLPELRQESFGKPFSDPSPESFPGGFLDT